ncbi:hypothetical protein [Paenibacillus harenae]|uniref:hypothetical protein n=1 Tax=Paenibacillus harenae TaxID=306543 RepID=UPI00040C6D1E|nr:hypothetical protein [Paenibacillus harenae]
MIRETFFSLNFNSLWYLGLGTLSTLLLFFVLFKTKNYRSLLLFLGMVGAGYTIEYFIFVLLESYAFYPKIISRDAYYDSTMGALASNLLTLPATAALIAVFRLNWIWIVIFTGIIVGIEWWFTKLGIYRHNWWRFEYTAIGLPIYYSFAKALFARLMHPLKGIPYFLTLYLITWALFTIQFVPLSFFNSRNFNLGWFENRSHDTTAFSSLSGMLSSIFFVWSSQLKSKYSWLKYLWPVAVVFGVNQFLKIIGVLHSLVWWDFLYCSAMNFILLIVIDAISKRLRNGPISGMN